MNAATEEDLAELKRFERDSDYLEAHYDELLDRYPEQWVAILDEKVVGTASELRQLLDELQGRDVPLERVLVEHLTRNDDILILPS
jgi:hypothetical protein